MPLDTRRWFDRTQPQTLQIATWLLYFRGGFALLDFITNSTSSWVGAARAFKGGLGTIAALAVIVACIGGGFLMANERKIGYLAALGGAFSPFLLRFWIYSGTGVSWADRFTGGSRNLLGLIFEIALCALLLHPQSRDHQRIWFR